MEQITTRKEVNKFFEFPELQRAIQALSSVCDGAVNLDGRGYNGRDAQFMNGLAMQARLSLKQATIAHRVLGIYKKQLLQHGIEYDKIPMPVEPSEQHQEAPVKKRETMKEAHKAGQFITIRFTAEHKDEFYDILDKVKSMDGRRFDSTTKQWSVPLSRTAVEQLIEWGFKLNEALHSFRLDKAPAKEPARVKMAGLYPFQEQGVEWIIKKDGRCLIGDEMGLGKTIQALAYLKLNPELRPAVVVCPASLKINWYRETHRWTPNDKPYVVYGRNNITAYKHASIIIINYDILGDHLEAIQALKPRVVIYDEVHYIKTPEAKRTKASKKLGKEVDKVIALSGTPITNKPIEFFSILNILRPDVFQSRFKFAMKYCDAKHNGFGWDFGGASNIEELHRIVTETVMIRRLKSNVLRELPQKQRSVIPVTIANRTDYDSAEEDLIAWIMDNEGKEAAVRAGRAEVLTRFEKLKQIAVRGKMAMVTDWIDSFLESEQKLVVFATHHETIDTLMAKYKTLAVKVDGRDSGDARQRSVDSFQNDPGTRLFIGNIKAAGVGLTLTAASNVAFVELDWVPGNHDQAEDRVHRIGQAADSINAWYLIAEQTIEEELVDILDRKRQVLDAVLDGRETDEGSILRELLKKYGAN